MWSLGVEVWSSRFRVLGFDFGVEGVRFEFPCLGLEQRLNGDSRRNLL